MNKILCVIGLITAIAGGVQAQINSDYFVNCDIAKVVRIEDGIEQTQYIYLHDYTGKIQVLYDHVNNEKPYVNAVYQCSPGSISETHLHSSGEVAAEALYTVDKGRPNHQRGKYPVSNLG